MKEDSQGRRVGGQDNNLYGVNLVSFPCSASFDIQMEFTDLGSSSVQGLGSLVGSLLQLAVVASRLDQVQDFLCVIVSTCHSLLIRIDIPVIPGTWQHRRWAKRRTRSG